MPQRQGEAGPHLVNEQDGAGADQLGELVNLRQQGKIRYLGVSGQPEVAAADLAEYADIVAVENLYNVAARDRRAGAAPRRTARHGVHPVVPARARGGHLVIGDEYSSDLGVHTSRGAREALLNAFAAELLLPSGVLTEERGASEAISRDQLIGLAARYRTSWSLAIRQATQAGILSGQTRHDWGRSAPTRSEFMEALGWHHNQISNLCECLPDTRMPSWRHGGRALSPARDLGEASVFAAAELCSATAITDDPASNRGGSRIKA
jgi:Aldo/keto reductase family